MNANLITGFGIAFSLSLLTTPLARRLAYKIGAIDHPTTERKSHTVPTPRSGGFAIAIGFLVAFLASFTLDRTLMGLLAGFVILLVVGVIDDIRGMRARTKLFWQFVAAGAVLAGGLGIIYITNPLGGVIALDHWRIAINLWGLHFHILPIANAVSLLWIVGMINAVNLLDGLDGLATGVSAIAAVILILLALAPATANPTVALLAFILLGSLLGFLPYNFYPSSIFMGDSGAYTVGMLLAVFSIYSGSKIAVGALVMGIAILDMAWAVLRRLVKGLSPFAPDRGHLHHRLVDSGLVSHVGAVVVIYSITILVGLTILVAGGVAAFSVMMLLIAAIALTLKLFTPPESRRL